MTLAIHHHVVHFLNAEISTDHRHVHVCLLILELLQTVDLNVRSTLNVQATEHVSMRNVVTHVLDLVASMQFVLSSITLQSAHVQNKTLVIRLQIVMPNLLHVRTCSSLFCLFVV